MFFDPLTAWFVSLLTTGIPWLKEKATKSIPAENWANKELIHRDIMAGNGDKLIENARKGKYINAEKHPEPHRDPQTGKIVIENERLYKEDCKKYGTHQAWKWLHQGKYNLTPEEFEKEKERIKKELEYLYRL